MSKNELMKLNAFCDQYYSGRYKRLIKKVFDFGFSKVNQIGSPSVYVPICLQFFRTPFDSAYAHYGFYLSSDEIGVWCLEYGDMTQTRRFYRKYSLKNQKQVLESLKLISEINFTGNEMEDMDTISDNIKGVVSGVRNT